MFLKNSDTDHFTDLIRAFWAIDPFSDLYTFGCVQLVYISPESMICNPMYWNMLLSRVYKEKLVAFVVDEAHCVKTW